MDDATFEAKNDLERTLLAAMEGEISSDEFMRALMAGQVFIPVQDEKATGIANFQRSPRATPLVIQDEAGMNILVMFTSPERAKDFLADVPGYSGGLLAEFNWILDRMEPGFSIAVNPGLEAGIDIGPETVLEMLELRAAEGTKN